MILHCKMNGDATDSSGNGHDGTPSESGVTFVDGVIGQALRVNGVSTTHVDYGADWIADSPLTIMSWIYPYNFGGGNFGRIIDNGKMIFYVRQSNLCLAFTSDGGAHIAYSAVGSIPTVNTLYHVAVTRDAAGKVNFFINGESSGTADQDGGTPQAGTTNVLLGNRADEARVFYGWFDDFRVDDEVLPVERIALIYKDGVGTEVMAPWAARRRRLLCAA